jgi:hypothetical protein
MTVDLSTRRIAPFGRFWQARHRPRYAAFNQKSSPRFPHSSLCTPAEPRRWAQIPVMGQPSRARDAGAVQHGGSEDCLRAQERDGRAQPPPAQGGATNYAISLLVPVSAE